MMNEPPRPWRRVLLAIALGIITTYAVAWSSALFAPWSASVRDTYALADHRGWQVCDLTAIGGRVIMWQSMTGLGRPMAEGRPLDDDEIDHDCIDRRQLARCKLIPVPTLGRPRDGVDSDITLQLVETRGWPLAAVSCTIRQDPTRWKQYQADVSAAMQRANPVPPPPCPASAEGWQQAQTANVSIAMPITIRGGFESPITTRARNQLSDTTTIPYRPHWPGFAANSGIFAAVWGLLLASGPFRRSHRLRHGRCPTCAYDLKGDLNGGCPECGWNRAACPPPLAHP